ncbi:MAG: hypothetical protein J1E16_04980 [Muribaculaceae bacterium]|nr:hypothetical protein [Muribaculaceae bacterium]
MKKIIFLTSFIIGVLFASCGGSSVKIDSNLNSEEANAVIKTEKSLPRGAKMESYEVVKSKLPLALLAEEYKDYRDQAYKARLDYRVNMTRGLQQVAEKNLQTLQNIQNIIKEKSKNLESTSPEYIFVLAEVKERERNDGKLTGYISVFDSNDLEQVDLIQVTTPLYNNAVMVTEALEGTLENPDQNTDNLKSSNLIVNFILNSNPK